MSETLLIKAARMTPGGRETNKAALIEMLLDHPSIDIKTRESLQHCTWLVVETAALLSSCLGIKDVT